MPELTPEERALLEEQAAQHAHYVYGVPRNEPRGTPADSAWQGVHEAFDTLGEWATVSTLSELAYLREKRVDPSVVVPIAQQMVLQVRRLQGS